MEKIIQKEELDKLMNLEGESRGMSLKGYGDYVLKEEGEGGLKRLEDAISGLGYPLNFNEIKAMDFYPLGLEAVTLIAIKRLFGYDNEKFQEMGKFEPKGSLILKLFMKYFVSLKRVAEEAPKMWRKYYTVGDLKVIDYDLDKRYIILRLENFRLHPLLCQDLIGYFSSVVKMVVGREEINCQETECVFRGGKYHEFLLKW